MSRTKRKCLKLKIGKRAIDHIVYCVPNLEAAIIDIEKRLGVRPVYGGRHLTKGTHNALLDLGDKCYLELLAVDPNNKEVSTNRWMGIDLIERPSVTRWALKSDDLIADQNTIGHYDIDLAQRAEGSRVNSSGLQLSWQMILPQSAPLVELVPFVIDWSSSETHPCDGLREGSCLLKSIVLKSPQNPELEATLSTLLGTDYRFTPAPTSEIAVTIQGHYGEIVIS